MADKEILAVTIDDSEFSEFKRKFDLYESAVKSLPAQWQKSGTEITSQKTNFEKMVAGASEFYLAMEHAAISQSASSRLIDTTGLAWAGIYKTGKLFHGHIHHATQSLMRWTKLTSIFSGLLSAGGLYGITNMAASVARQRTSAMGLGVTYGERASFLTNFGRLGNAEGILQGFSEAETDVSKKYALRQYLGHTESGDPAKDFAEGLGRFKGFVDQYKDQPGMLGPMLHARGYDKLGIGTEQARIVQGMSAQEVAQIASGYRGDVAGRLGLSDADAKKWTEFSNQMERAGLEIETVFAKGTIKLAKPLEHLSESFIHLTENLLKDGSPISGWIKDLGRGIRTFADELGSGAVQAKAADLGRNIADTVKLFDAILAKAPGGLALLTGMGVGARFGGAAVAVGAGLARSAVTGPLGAGAAAVGATAWGMNKLMPQHPERLKRGQEYENAGGSPRSPHPAQTEHRRQQRQSLSESPGIRLGPGDENIPLSGGAAGRADSLSGMQPGFRARLAAMMHDAPPGSSVFSGYRSPALQAQLYHGPHRPGYVARPGHSHHGFGDAADIHGNLGWFHQHAHEYGLRFPMLDPHRRPYETWHIQSDPDTRVPLPHHILPQQSSPSRRAFGHQHVVGHHPATIGQQQHSMVIEDQTGGMVSVMGGSSNRYIKPDDRGAMFRHAADFYRMRPEHFQPMIGDVEDRRFENGWPGFPAATDIKLGSMAKRLSGRGKSLAAEHHPSGMPKIEKSVDDYISKSEKGLWDSVVPQS